METRRWTNPSQPQTLQTAVILLYINAVFMVLGGLSGIGLLLTAGYAAGGFGIANERRWGYGVALAVAAFALLFWVRLLFVDVGDFFEAALSLSGISLMFDVALLALLLHPQSRDYQRIWFS